VVSISTISLEVYKFSLHDRQISTMANFSGMGASYIDPKKKERKKEILIFLY
jgi:hypothetical protein